MSQGSPQIPASTCPSSKGACADAVDEHTYKAYLLDDEPISFPDDEPDISPMPITAIDMDPTERCNLRCSYCFKGKLPGREMSQDTAKQAVRFLVRYSAQARKLDISLMGGEPMLSLGLLKQWVPWAMNYCEQRGKKLTIGATTNGTVFDQERHDFCRRWNIGLHLSIDGFPVVQDRERVFRNGRGSSAKLEANLPRIFSAWRTIHARSSIVPETVQHLSDSYRYFCEKGFLKVAFSLVAGPGWDDEHVLTALQSEYTKVLEHHWQHMKAHDQYFVLTGLDHFVRQSRATAPQTTICGAARGMLHVDADGLLWPCHRFNGKRPHKHLILGSIWGGFNNALRDSFLRINTKRDMRQACTDCEAKMVCVTPCVAANWQEQGDIFDVGDGYCEAIRTLYRCHRGHAERMQTDDPERWQQYLGWVQDFTW